MTDKTYKEGKNVFLTFKLPFVKRVRLSLSEGRVTKSQPGQKMPDVGVGATRRYFSKFSTGFPVVLLENLSFKSIGSYDPFSHIRVLFFIIVF